MKCKFRLIALAASLLLAATPALAETDEQFFARPDAFALIAQILGCGHKYSEDKAAAMFASAKGHAMLVTGEVARVSGNEVDLKVLPGTITYDVAIKLVDASAAYNLEKGQRLSIRFTLQEHGGCILPFSGDGGQIVR